MESCKLTRRDYQNWYDNGPDPCEQSTFLFQRSDRYDNGTISFPCGRSLSEKVALAGQEAKNSLIAAEDLVKLHIKGEIGKLETDTERLQHTLLEKQGNWTDARLDDIGNHLDDQKQRLKHLTDVVECKDKYHQRLFN